MTNQLLWEPSSELIQASNLKRFINEVNLDYNLNLNSYADLHNWSIDNIEKFWSKTFSFSKIIYEGEIVSVIDDASKMPGNEWFKGVKLNYAENLLRHNTDCIAIEFYNESNQKIVLTYKNLHQRVASLSSFLRSIGVKSGDRVAAVIPNIPEAIIMMLASSSIGAIWTSCSPDFGVNAILDRFEQVNPKVLLVSDGYIFKGKYFSIDSKIKLISDKLSSLTSIVSVDYVKESSLIGKIDKVVPWGQLIDEYKEKKIHFTRLPFNHPLYIMYSSGTTGKPKSIVHSSGGTLLQHLKEHILHVDLKKEDKIFYYTTCGWMMWNWLISGLSIGSTIVLFDGNPFHPNKTHLLKIANRENISIFGTSAKFIDSIEKSNVIPSKVGRFKKLKTILSTGSPLLDNNFDFIYNKWKTNVQLSSISGGTDIISCFALGSPMLPVYKNELQCIGLGMDVSSYNELGESVIEEKGELVCRKPFPSMPIYFWGDSNGELYQKTYFSRYKGVWNHGDYISINKKGGVVIHGRSDSTLNPGGVRIGTSEIYKIVEKNEDVLDSVAIGKVIDGDERILLFVKVNRDLSKELKDSIRENLKINGSPRHIPYKIIQVEDIPYTLNGKKIEVAIKKILNKEEVLNKESIANPESLSFFKKISI